MSLTGDACETLRTDVLGEARDYQDLHEILRARAETIGMSRELIDEVAGLSRGHASKLLAPIPMKRLGAVTLGPILQSLGIKLIAVEDQETAERIRQRRNFRPRNPSRVRTLNLKQAERRLMRRLGKRGAKARNAQLTPEQRSEACRAAALAKWSAMSAAQRSESSRRLSNARWSKRR